ncbi:MAG TPA: hypothetical protein VIE86_04920 [Nitrososphaera sp.]|jgi:hypothetical protein
MGRTVPSFRLAQIYEESEWKEFRNALSKSERKEFDSMFATSQLYISACSYATKPVLIQPILMSMIFHHYKQLLDISKTLSEDAVNESISR